MNLLEVDIERLHTNNWNTNEVNPSNQKKLEEAIKRFGFFKPIIARETEQGLEIIGGEHRWLAAKNLKYKTVPVINLGVLEDKKAKEISLADNSRYGSDDAIYLAKLLEEIDTAAVSEYLPFTEGEIESIFKNIDISIDELETSEIKIENELRNEAPVKAPKTHTILRFKVSLSDAEKISELIAKIRKKQDYNSSDDLTNAGDALVHIVFGKKEKDE